MIKTRARIMKVVAAAAIGFLVAGMSATAATAVQVDSPGGQDSPEVKVWVCKYVTTPGQDEVLKRGNDGLVNVSANTLHGQDVVVGASFSDAHGRSLVVQIGGDRPDVSVVCPGYKVPVTAENPTATPVCGPNNDIVNLPSTKGVKYTATAWDKNKLQVTATEEPGYSLSGTASWKFTDANKACPVQEQFVTIIWNMNPVGPPPVFNPTQTLVDSKITSTPELGAFDHLLVGKCVGFQVDVYTYTNDADIAAVKHLILTQKLFGPNNPTEPLIPGGLGTAWKFYQNADCGSEPELVAPEFPEPVPPTCDADGEKPALPSTPGVTYTWDGNTLKAAPASDDYVFADDAVKSRTYDLGTAIGYQSNDAEGTCYSENPEPLSGNVESNTGQCTAPLDGTYTTVTTTTPWTQEWVLDAATGLWSLGEKVNGTPVVTESVTADGTCVVELTGATPADPTVTPMCGPLNDVVTIPSTTGVVYTDEGWDGSSHTITAAAAEGYTLTGTVSWTFVDEAVACPVEITDTAVTPEPPTVVAKCLPNNDTVTLPTTVGVIYTAGEWFGGKLTVTAAAAEGYTLSGDASWTFTDVPSAACPDEEPAFSFVPTAQLAQTGTSDGTLGLAVLAMLLISTGAVLASRKVRVQ